MKYPILKKRCRNQHNNKEDCEICGDCRRAWAKLCKEFEQKYILVKIKVECTNCNGAGCWSGKYGQTACEDCNTRGYNWKEKWKH